MTAPTPQTASTPARSRGLAAMGWRAALATCGVTIAALAAFACWEIGRTQGLGSASVACGALGAVAIALLIVLDRGLGRTLRRLRVALDAIRQGDLSVGCALSEPGEIGAIGAALAAMNFNLSAIVADVRSQSTLVSDAGRSLADGTAELSKRTVRQAEGLQQASAGVQQLGGSVQQNARDAQSVEVLAHEVHKAAESGAGRMREAVDSMRAIQDSSEKVQDIVGVIDGIAFQTNILALNAAVEAARAGEHGRGFAVVAAEVRALALRSGSAAREIQQLIAASGEQVRSGVGRIEQVGQVLGDMVDGIGRVADRVRSITTAAAQQGAGLHDMGDALRNLDEITGENSRMVERTSRASSGLGERAKGLAATVSGFRLRQGTADEAHALVLRAAELFGRRGTACLADITSATGGFADRDMYVFAWDRQLVYHAFAGKPHNVGKRADQIIGTDVTQLGADVWAAAAAGGGWVDYDFVNPVDGRVAPKTSYVVPVSKDMVLGCGIYRTVQRQ